MTKIFSENLVLEKDTVFDECIEVHGSIAGKNGKRFNLTVKGNINAWDINALDINALDINAWDINALDINALDINALDINAGNISYYAVCFAHENIKCKSIKGRRKNAKHFTLDGKIIIKKDAGEKK